jgi:hypothetical protein
MGTHLKQLLQARHLQTHTSFCREYDRLAKRLDPALVGTGPSRATLHRWMTGDVKRLPYPDHCRILEAMFPGWTAEQLIQSCDDGLVSDVPRPVVQLIETVRQGLAEPDASPASWRGALQSNGGPGTDTLILPPRVSEPVSSDDRDLAHDLGRKLMALQKTLRLSDDEIRMVADLSGQVVELSTTVGITIGVDGGSVVTYTHEILNLTATPLRRVPREIWFKHAAAPGLTIAPIQLDGRRLMIQRTHDAATMSKFGCQFRPAVDPGDMARFGYSCTGGRFIDEFYWRQAVTRHTRHLTISVKQEGVTLLRCSAVEELQDGSEVYATDEILWDYEGQDVTMTVTRDYLQPNQALTLRWEIERAEGTP